MKEQQQFEIGDTVRIIDCQKNLITGLALEGMQMFIGSITKIKVRRDSFGNIIKSYSYSLEGNSYLWNYNWLEKVIDNDEEYFDNEEFLI